LEAAKTRLGRFGDRNPGPNDPNAPGWLKTLRSGIDEFILTPATFQQDLCGSLSQSKVIGILASKEILVRNEDKKSTVQRTIPGIKAARGHRYFVLDRKALNTWLKQS